MHRKHTKYCIHYLFDLLGLGTSWFAAVQLRGLLQPYLSGDFARDEILASNPPILMLVTAWVVAGLWTGGLRPRYRRFYDLAPLVQTVLLSGCLLIVAMFFFRIFRMELSRLFVLLTIPVSLLCVVVAGSLTALVTQWLDSHWPSPERVAVLGQSDEAWSVVDRIEHSGRRVSVAGLILPHNAAPPQNGRRLPVIGTTSALASVINHTRLDRIIILDGCATDREVDECGAISKRMGVVFSRAIKVPEKFVKLELVERFGMSLLDVRPVAFTRRQEIVKRCFDMVVSSLLMVVAAPLFLMLATMIALTSDGPVLYRAPRVGRGGRHFTCLKFRSMYLDKGDRRSLVTVNEKNGHIFKLREDPRVTPLGRFLRKYSLDELPQMLNVLRGDMSLVGPRPLPAGDLDPDGQSREFKSWSEGRSRVLPGITGLWQICGRSDVPFEKMTELDITYIREWSLLLDLRILIKTPIVVITGRGAY
jgi:exopolysaccharide biosynthesis polyprenyl glycosylphosphotransferase